MIYQIYIYCFLPTFSVNVISILFGLIM